MALIAPDSVFMTDNLAMDEAHAEFVGLLNQMETADNEQFAALFSELLAHTEAHFNDENLLMEQSGFPATAEHQAEHRRILAELKQFKKRIDKGLVAFAKAYVMEKLPEWFKLHLSTMDAALVAHLKRQ